MRDDVQLRVMRGEPSDEELAALVVILSAALSAAQPTLGPAGSGPRAQWGAPGRAVRSPVAPTGWWESALPR